MFFIAVLFPAVISVYIIHLRNSELKYKSIKTLFEYAICILINVLLASLVVCVLLGGDVRADSFQSVRFFVKYTGIAVVLAVIVPYIWEVIKTYIRVELVIEEYEKN